MPDHYLPGDPDIPLILRRSARARRISLRVSHLDGRVTLTTPSHVPDTEAIAFARQKEAWIRQHLARRPEDVVITPGCTLPVEGTLRDVRVDGVRRVKLLDDALILPDSRPTGPVAQAFLKNLARERLTSAADHYARVLGRSYARISLRDTRSRWGSCSSHGALMFSWRLILAPRSVLSYVAAHEVAHLAEMNHSSAFWATVTRIHGPWEEQRQWLHKHGSRLHAYRFVS